MRITGRPTSLYSWGLSLFPLQMSTNHVFKHKSPQACGLINILRALIWRETLKVRFGFFDWICFLLKEYSPKEHASIVPGKGLVNVSYLL